jgi:hypothetical protein
MIQNLSILNFDKVFRCFLLFPNYILRVLTVCTYKDFDETPLAEIGHEVYVGRVNRFLDVAFRYSCLNKKYNQV